MLQINSVCFPCQQDDCVLTTGLIGDGTFWVSKQVDHVSSIAMAMAMAMVLTGGDAFAASKSFSTGCNFEVIYINIYKYILWAYMGKTTRHETKK